MSIKFINFKSFSKITSYGILSLGIALATFAMSTSISMADTCEDGPDIPCVPVSSPAIKTDVNSLYLDGFYEMYSDDVIAPGDEYGDYGDGGGEQEYDSDVPMSERDDEYEDRERCMAYGMRAGKYYGLDEIGDFGFVRGDGSDMHSSTSTIYDANSSERHGTVKFGKACMF
jgi:hypothetical protein